MTPGAASIVSDAADRAGPFAGDDPFDLARAWLAEATPLEPNDPNAIALATVDAEGRPDVRIVLLKDIDGSGTDGTFVFYTNYGSAKAREIAATGQAAFVLHWKSTRRQVRVRGTVSREDGPQADAYFASRSPKSRLGAWASRQSSPVADRAELLAAVESARVRHGEDPPRPPFWGGFRIHPLEIEFWADGESRLHDRFRWSRDRPGSPWAIARLSP